MIDEILHEVRTVKEALAQQSGYDIRRMAEEIQKSEVQSARQGWQHVPAPVMPMPESAFRLTRFAHR